MLHLPYYLYTEGRRTMDALLGRAKTGSNFTSSVDGGGEREKGHIHMTSSVSSWLGNGGARAETKGTEVV